VHTVAPCLWRTAFVLRAENGEIRKRVDTVQVDQALRDSDRGNLGLALSKMDLPLFSAGNPSDAKVSTREYWSAIQVAQTDLRGHHSGLAYLSALLKIAKSQIASDGHISEWIAKKIFNGFGFWDCLFALICFYDGLPEDKMEGRPSRKAGDKQADKQRAIVAAAVDDQLERINELKERATEREDLAGDAEARSFSLPPVDATDKLLRSPRQATLSRHGPA
jgi:hypothetical protein